MKSFYIVITSEFADMMSGKESSINKGSFFGYATTTDGRFVCSSNTLDDFPEEFQFFTELVVIPLATSDFPTTPSIT